MKPVQILLGLLGIGLLSKKGVKASVPGVNYGKVLSYAELVDYWKKQVELGLPNAFILAIIAQESGGYTNAKGSSGEIGLMQLTYPAYVDSGVKWKFEELWEPEKNIESGIRYLKWIENYLTKKGVPSREITQGTVISYNIGVGNYLGNNHMDKGLDYWNKILHHRDIIIKRGFGV